MFHPRPRGRGPEDAPTKCLCRADRSVAAPLNRLLLQLQRTMIFPIIPQSSGPILAKLLARCAAVFGDQELHEISYFSLYVRWQLLDQFGQRPGRHAISLPLVPRLLTRILLYSQRFSQKNRYCWVKQHAHSGGVSVLRAAYSRTARTCSGETSGNHSTNWETCAPSSRFSNNAATGTRVPRIFRRAARHSEGHYQ